MFGNRYFGQRYFGDRYWGNGGSITPPDPTPSPSTGGGGGGRFQPTREQQRKWDEQVRKRRERTEERDAEDDRLLELVWNKAHGIELPTEAVAEIVADVPAPIVAKARTVAKPDADTKAWQDLKAVLDQFRAEVNRIEAQLAEEQQEREDVATIARMFW